jgi:hypothetical protein
MHFQAYGLGRNPLLLLSFLLSSTLQISSLHLAGLVSVINTRVQLSGARETDRPASQKYESTRDKINSFRRHSEAQGIPFSGGRNLLPGTGRAREG